MRYNKYMEEKTAYNKYRVSPKAQRTIDGITFASKLEKKRYCELVLLLKAKEIFNLVMQKKYILQEKFEKNGVKYREISYVSDFEYTTKELKLVIEDCKGMKTPEYIIKKKLFEYKYPHLTITEVKK